MSRRPFFVGIICAVMLACSGPPHEPAPNDGSEVTEFGTLELPLTSETNGNAYRLSSAKFTIEGAPLPGPFDIEPIPDEFMHTETLPVGSYSIVLHEGWVLERKNADGNYEAVKAVLITRNPAKFRIRRNRSTDVFFGFRTPGGDVDLGDGRVNVKIGVQECTSFNGITAAIASYTVECLGTIDGDSFSVNADGVMSRNFDACVTGDTELLDSIDGFLSLQFRPQRAPFAKECIAGRWSQWRAEFDESGLTECPVWRKELDIGTPTAEIVDRLIPLLAQLPSEDDGERPPFLSQLKENTLYSVTFDQPPPNAACQTPGECAALCAGGFPGFVIRVDGETVLTDPDYWNEDWLYPSPQLDPFHPLRRPGYYHPMSYYGPLPGERFAHRNRFRPCQQRVLPLTEPDPKCPPENCSYYVGPHQFHLPLKIDCLDPNNLGSCVAYCDNL